MRILHTAHSYAPEITGVAEVVKHISARLAKRGHEVWVATGRPPNSPSEECINGINVVRFSVNGNLVSSLSGDIEEYRRFVLNGSWDVVAMHCVQSWTTDALVEMANAFRFPFVVVSHGMSAWRSPRYEEYFDLLGVALRGCAKIVSLSSLLEEGDFCLKYNLPPPYVIGNGADLQEWGGNLRGVRERWKIGAKPWVLSVGNHSSVKGHDRFFRLSRSVINKIPETYCCIIGGSHRAEKWGVGKLGIPGGCSLLCHLKSLATPVRLINPCRSDTISAIREADVIAITSRREACPVVAIEAMAAGTPWVSFDVGNVRENTGGFVVQSERELLEKVILLLETPAIRRELAGAGRLRARGKHDWDKIADEYERIYQNAAKRR